VQKIKKKYFLIFLIIVPAVILVFKFCSRNKAVVYEYSKVSNGEVSKTIAVQGKLDLYESFIVTSLIQGSVINVYTDFNDVVKKGEKLALLESSSVDQKVFTYAETHRKAKYELESQREFLESKKNLYSESLIAKKELDLAEKSYNMALSNYNSVKITYDTILEEQRSKTVVSPTNGFIIQMWAELRKQVSNGTPLFLIAPTLKKMRLIIDIDESDVGNVSKGQQVEFTVSAYPDEKFYGEIEHVRMNPKTVNQIVTYESLVICDNSKDLLRPGMTASAVVKIDRKDSVLRVPNQAFSVNPEKTDPTPGVRYLWIKRAISSGSKPIKKVKVVTGVEGDFFTEIVSGSIKEGDEVLIGLYQKEMD
jgi:HlyD family secretion protein